MSQIYELKSIFSLRLEEDRPNSIDVLGRWKNNSPIIMLNVHFKQDKDEKVYIQTPECYLELTSPLGQGMYATRVELHTPNNPFGTLSLHTYNTVTHCYNNFLQCKLQNIVDYNSVQLRDDFTLTLEEMYCIDEVKDWSIEKTKDNCLTVSYQSDIVDSVPYLFVGHSGFTASDFCNMDLEKYAIQLPDLCADNPEHHLNKIKFVLSNISSYADTIYLLKCTYNTNITSDTKSVFTKSIKIICKEEI